MHVLEVFDPAFQPVRLAPANQAAVFRTVDLAVELGPGARIVTLACDSGIKYLGGEIFA